jgi:hypothetical protein
VNTQSPNPDHNIWNNNGTYWCHYTVHGNDKTARRVRVSLETKDIAEARRRRDVLIRNTPNVSTKVTWPRAPRGQAMPDVGLDICESRAVARAHGYRAITGRLL